MQRSVSLFLTVISICFINQYGFGWGSYGHSHITSAAVEDLPLSMETVFQPVKQWLADTSTDAGIRTSWDPNERYFHYIDADSNPNCQWPFTCLPRNVDDYLTQYGVSNGFNVYIIDSLTLVLSTVYRNWKDNPTGSNFTTALYWMTRTAHYMEDIHQPFHCTKDYNPDGVHSRYESQMLNEFSPVIASSRGSGAIYQANPLEFAFSVISTAYPYYPKIVNVDTTAKHLFGTTYSPAYYTYLWEHTRSFTTTLLNLAAKDVASIWYTAWVNAGLTLPEQHNLLVTHPHPVALPASKTH